MNFGRPGDGLTYEARVAQEAERMRNRSAKAAERRRNRHDGFFDNETVEPPEFELPTEPPPCASGCGRPARALRGGLCGACQKAERRKRGLSN